MSGRCPVSIFMHLARVYSRQIMPWHNNVHILVLVLCASQDCSHVFTQNFKTSAISLSLLQRVCICWFHCHLGFPVLFDNVDKWIRFSIAIPNKCRKASVYKKSWTLSGANFINPLIIAMDFLQHNAFHVCEPFAHKTTWSLCHFKYKPCCFFPHFISFASILLFLCSPLSLCAFISCIIHRLDDIFKEL